MTGVRPRHDTIPDVIEITLYYWDTCRWRPHLIQYKDSLPIQGKKDFNIMLNTLKTSISTSLNLECTPITKDLLDDIS